MGATGALQRTFNDAAKLPYGRLVGPTTRVGISHMHNYFFRLDFDLGGTANDDVFERVDVVADATASTRTKSITPFLAEGYDDVAPDLLRTWRVRDSALTNGNGHSISYALTPLEFGHRDVGPPGEPFTHHDVYVTRHAAEELYASHNNRAELFPDAGENVTDFYDPPESLVGEDLVVWYGISFHHSPRDEDETRMHAHWNGFRIEPRDWTDSRPSMRRPGFRRGSWSIQPADSWAERSTSLQPASTP
jgi:Cu2+-containing amine oxidase